MKCRRCGLVNFRDAAACKRCGEPSPDAPPPAAGWPSDAWRDADFLVMHEAARLPARCMKCNSPAGVSRKEITVGYYPKYNLALLLFGFVFYKTFRVGVYLCGRHLSTRGKAVVFSTLLIVGGVAAFVFGFSSYSTPLLAAGVAAFAAGCALLTIGGSPVSIERVGQPYLWIKGASREYLAALPRWTNG